MYLQANRFFCNLILRLLFDVYFQSALILVYKVSTFSEKFFSKRDLVVEEMEETTAKLDVVRDNHIFYAVYCNFWMLCYILLN